MDKPIRVVTYADLVGRSEIAERAGVAVRTIDGWRRKHAAGPTPFPDPAWTYSGTPVWEWPEVEAWLRDTPRDVGRPPIVVRHTPARPLPARLSHLDPETHDPGDGGHAREETA